MNLSVVIITKNAGDVIHDCLVSVDGLWSELLVADDHSTDKTLGNVLRFGGKLIHLDGLNLGERKKKLVSMAKFEWVLVIDSDERVSRELYTEIQNIVTSKKIKEVGFSIPYQNYVFGKPVHFGGERYSKVRLFRKKYGTVSAVPLHEEIEIEGLIGKTRGVLHHHSYRNLSQLFNKFTGYAGVAAQQMYDVGERVTVQKLLLYGPHMFWARFWEDRGWKDGSRGFVLAFAFGYLESLTYWLLAWRRLVHEK